MLQINWKVSREQYSYLEKQADRATNMNRKKIQEAVAVALSKAIDSAETVKFVILSWGIAMTIC